MRKRLISWVVIGWILLVWLFWFRGTAQTFDWQSRQAAHFQAEIGGKWFLAGWAIENARTVAINNTNFIWGVGFGGPDHWIECMAQRQLSQTGGFWGVDQRYFRKIGSRWSLFVEATIIVSKPGFYEYVALEYKLSQRWSLRSETENTHRVDRQSIAAGGGMNLKLAEGKGWKLSMAVVYRASPTGKGEPRLYLNATKRFSLRGRKQ